MGDVDSDRRRSRLDFVLAGCICLAAVLYGFWDNSPGPQTPVTVSASTSLPNQLSDNDEGYRLFSASDYVGAEAKFRSAIHARPNDAVGYSNLGAALIAQRRFDEAVAALRKAIELDPSLTLARNNLAWALVEKAKHGK
jgi:Flp pilus assembly protein TadD